MRISDWSSDVCSSDLDERRDHRRQRESRDRQGHEDPARDDHTEDQAIHRAALASLPVWTSSRIRSVERPAQASARSEERRVGKECVSTCRSRWSPYHKKQKKKKKNDRTTINCQ